MSAAVAEPRDRSIFVLVVSGALGYAAGRYWYPDWQVAVETAQVLAGLVTYPLDNPFYIYHLKLWTIVHHALAVALWAGISERTLSEVLSGVMGMASFQALAMVAYAMSRRVVLALSSIAVIIAARAAEFGVIYPIAMTGTVHTYGALGLSIVVLTAGLFGCGRAGLALFLAGLAPAIHPALGAWLALILLLTAVWDLKEVRAHWRASWKYFAAGAGLTALSLAYHLAFTAPDTPLSPADAQRYQATFTALWDVHRQPVELGAAGVRLNAAAAALAMVWLAAFRSDLPRHAAFLLRFVLASAAVGLVGMLVTWMPAERVPALLLTLMPGRLLNVNAMACAALLLGLAGLYWCRAWGAATALGLTLALLVTRPSYVWFWADRRQWDVPRVVLDPLLIIMLAAAVLIVGRVVIGNRGARSGERGADSGERAAAVLARTGCAAVALWVTWMSALPLPRRHATGMIDRTNDVALAGAAQGSGLLATGGEMFLVQLRTRRPVLINSGALDTVAYAIDSAPAMERILRDVYALDYFHPPAEALHGAVVPTAYNRVAWSGYDTARWQEIRRAFNVTQVLTPAGWELRLPIVAQSRRYLLYDIPE